MNFFNFIDTSIPETRRIEKGSFVSLKISNGQSVEGKVLDWDENFLALETYTGNTPIEENKSIREYAQQNDGHIVDYTIFRVAEIKSITKFTKLEINGQEKT